MIEHKLIVIKEGIFLTFISLLLTVCAGYQKQPSVEITIYHTHDMHRCVVGNDTEVMGIDRHDSGKP